MDFKGDPLGYWGRNIIEDYDNVLLKKLPTDEYLRVQEGGLASLPSLSEEGMDGGALMEAVGILGAGVGGLYTALILDSLGIRYEILEASADRTGGRLFTHKFQEGKEYDYYDVGAMRYPLPKKDDNGDYEPGVMRRLGMLINYSKLNDGAEPLKNKLIDYHFEAEGTFLYFNNVRRQRPTGDESFRAEEMGVESAYIKVGAGKIISDVVDPFADMILRDLQTGEHTGWETVKEHDVYSLRAYMSLKYLPSEKVELPPKHLSTNVVNWCETFDNSSGSYDRSLTEHVIEALAFATVGEEVEWKCFDGGSHVLTDYMTKYIKSTGTDLIKPGKRVTSISQGTNVVNVSAGDKSFQYSHVISTIPLPCLRTIDLSDAGLNVMQKTALRKLKYGPSIKIGIRFKTAWWRDRFNIVGGQSSTDLPVRTIVYPSYGATPGQFSTVLIASYCWTSDAERLGALINTGKTEYKEQLKELVLRNLAEVHNIPYSDLLDEFNEFKEMHAWDWNNDPLTMGAFAFFGPGDFQDLYKSLTTPAANQRLHFAGEAISTRHAWVVGALDSAWRAVYEYLCATQEPDSEVTKEFFRLWGKNIEWTQPSARYAAGEENTLLRVHMGCTYAAERAGEVKF